MLKGKKIKGLAVVVLLTIISVLAWAVQQHMLKVAQVKVALADTAFKHKVYDQQLLNKFEKLLARYDTLKTNYTIAGSITAVDKADTGKKMMRDVPFFYCKQGDSFDYRMGEAEIINANGLFIKIDRQEKSIILSAQKKIVDSQGQQMIQGLSAGLRSEQYNLVSRENGGQETISLINEHHITCKQYSVTFDTAGMKIDRIYMRLTNIQDPLRKDNEKIVDMKISRWESTTDFEKYGFEGRVLEHHGNVIKPIAEYSTYRLIRM